VKVNQTGQQVKKNEAHLVYVVEMNLVHDQFVNDVEYKETIHHTRNHTKTGMGNAFLKMETHVHQISHGDK